MLFTDISSTQTCMMSQDIKDASSMLALTFEVREKKFLSRICLQNENYSLNLLHLIILTAHVTRIFSMSAS